MNLSDLDDDFAAARAWKPTTRPKRATNSATPDLFTLPVLRTYDDIIADFNSFASTRGFTLRLRSGPPGMPLETFDWQTGEAVK